ncbi:MAG: hypothetical protein ACMXYK_02425 [Candidatus Woesearchaeota archaeon]
MKKAEAGIGVLIVFIAMILIAAIAAGVLITISSQLQSTAITTGQQTRDQVSTALVPLQVYVLDQDNTTNRVYNFTFIKTRLTAGSNSIRLTDALLRIDIEGTNQNYQYNGSIGCANASALPVGTFSANFISGGDDVNYINQGDLADLCFFTPTALNESQSFRISFVPNSGQPMYLDLTTPMVMIKMREEIFP